MAASDRFDHLFHMNPNYQCPYNADEQQKLVEACKRHLNIAEHTYNTVWISQNYEYASACLQLLFNRRLQISRRNNSNKGALRIAVRYAALDAESGVNEQDPLSVNMKQQIIVSLDLKSDRHLPMSWEGPETHHVRSNPLLSKEGEAPTRDSTPVVTKGHVSGLQELAHDGVKKDGEAATLRSEIPKIASPLSVSHPNVDLKGEEWTDFKRRSPNLL